MAAPRIHPTVPQQVRARLEANKSAGVAFDAAWERALHRLDYVRGEDSRAWREAMAATREEWHAAYDEQWTPLAALAGLSLEELVAAGRDGLELAA